MDSKIQDIITKRILEEVSSEELVILKKWRRESTHNENLYQEYVAIWDASANYTSIDFHPKAESAYQKHLALLDKEEKVGQLNLNKSIPPSTNKSSTKLFSIRRLSSIAALFVIAFGAMVVINSMGKTTLTAEEGVTFASLEDGSSIWLDQGSSLTYSRGFGENHRNLKLEGKAFFDVKRNENLSFKISSNDLDVSVIGTSFTIDTKDGKNIVSVKSGKVSVSASGKEITLVANDKVSFENNHFVEQQAEVADVVWRNQNLSFNNAPLGQVISDINLYHGNKIELDVDINHLDCPFTARSLANTSFENIIEILEITYDLEIENQENGNVSIKFSDCK